ncbi:hypothetical protein PYCC9005_001477 [Savitreella phatthalungensis]
MCGRFAQSFESAYIAQQLESGGLGVDDVRDSDTPRRPTYNAAPQTYQAVYRSVHGPSDASERTDGKTAESSTVTRGTNTEDTDTARPTRVLQSMKWGLVPFWTKRPPESASQLKTINCRDDSLIEGGRSMWNTMKERKRCIVPVQGYYEWQKRGRERLPFFTRRKDGGMMLLGGLYDSVRYETLPEDSPPLWTFTIITTAAAEGMGWLHDRMPLMFEEKCDAQLIAKWLDGQTWDDECAAMLRPFDPSKLESYAVKKDVGKVGNDSPSFIVPIDSKENKDNIANYFARSRSPVAKHEDEIDQPTDDETDRKETTENNAPMPEKHLHPHHAKGPAKEDLVPENELPFDFIPSHLETRPFEGLVVRTLTLRKAETGKIVDFIAKKLRSRDLNHLKRMRPIEDAKRVKVEDGEVRSRRNDPDGLVQILLCKADEMTEHELRQALDDHGVPEAKLEEVEVSRFPALSQKQFDAWKERWPLNWRVPATRRVNMTRADLERCQAVMEQCLSFAAQETTDGDLPVAAIAWNAETGEELARAKDARSSSGHPLKHAVMELVGAVAANEVVRRIEQPETAAQYLCTGLTIFISHEPCTMCCMALLHARAERVFFAKASERGGFASSYGIHYRKELNHRFAVFGGWMETRAESLEPDEYV